MENQNNRTLRDSLKDLGKVVDDFFDSVDDFIDKHGHKLTYSEYMDITSEYVDKKILTESNNKGLVCFGGKCKISTVSAVVKNVEEICLLASVELFFQNSEGKWVKSGFSGKTPYRKFNLDDNATVEQLEKFKGGYVEEINVEPPTERKDR